MRASVGGHKVPHRRRVVTIGKSGCGRGVLGLALVLTLVLGLSFGTVCCLSSVSAVSGALSMV